MEVRNLTRQELAEALNISEVTIMSSFKRTQIAFEKRGILISKKGRGDSAEYTLEYVNKKEE